MGDLLTYSIEDFLPFGREAFHLLLTNYSEQFWPLSLFMMLLATIAVTTTIWRTHYAAWLLTIPWFWIAFVYYRTWYEQLNWAADYFVFVCAGQALLLAISIRDRHDVREWHLVFPIAVLIVTPFANHLFFEEWWVETVGFTPLATSVFFLAWLATVRPFRWWLAIIPAVIAIVELSTYSMTS